MTTQPAREPGPRRGEGSEPAQSEPAQLEPAQFERVRLTGEQRRLVRFMLLLVAATLLFSAVTMFVVVR